MRYIVKANYSRYEFESETTAMSFARLAKTSSVDKDPEVVIVLKDDPVEEEEEDE